MDRDSMLHYTSVHYSPAEPLSFSSGPVFASSAEDDFSSDSSHDNFASPHTLAVANGTFPAEEDGFPFSASISNNRHYGGAPAVSVPARPRRLNGKGNSLKSKSMDNRAFKAQPAVIRYHECMKNHAASLGGHAVDGCGEFLACGSDGFDALMCSVCGCHRNFHRREVEGQQLCSCKLQNVQVSTNFKGVSGPPTPGILAIPSSREVVLHAPPNLPTSSCGYLDDADLLSNSLSRKRRHRTKFSCEQKERMFAFAEYLGWRTAEQNEVLVQHFCDEIGVKRGVFKVWMHNNKNNATKRMNSGDSTMLRNYESPSEY